MHRYQGKGDEEPLCATGRRRTLEERPTAPARSSGRTGPENNPQPVGELVAVGLGEAVSEPDSVALGDGLVEVDPDDEGLGDSDDEGLGDSDPPGEVDALTVGDVGDPDTTADADEVGETLEVGEASSPVTVPGWSSSMIVRICSL